MMYDAYQSYDDFSHQVRFVASAGKRLLREWRSTRYVSPLRLLEAYYELIALAGFTHTRPDYGITQLTIPDGALVDVTQEPVLTTPFCTILRYSRCNSSNLPRVLLVAPLSGHFATLLRGTIRTLLREHDVYVTDWHNARDIPLDKGAFGFDDFVQHLVDFCRYVVVELQPFMVFGSSRLLGRDQLVTRGHTSGHACVSESAR